MKLELIPHILNIIEIFIWFLLANFVSKYFQYFFENKEIQKEHDIKIAKEILNKISVKWFWDLIKDTTLSSFHRSHYDVMSFYKYLYETHTFYNTDIQKYFNIFIVSLHQYQSLLYKNYQPLDHDRSVVKIVDENQIDQILDQVEPLSTIVEQQQKDFLNLIRKKLPKASIDTYETQNHNY